jgi:hypothetical protein
MKGVEVANLGGGGSSSTESAIIAGKTTVEVDAKNDKLKAKLEESKSSLTKWTGNVKASFEQAAAGSRALGTGIATAVASGSTDLKSLTMQVVGSLGPWGALAAGVIAVTGALGDMIKEGEKAVSTLDKVRKTQFEADSADRKKLDMEAIGEFQKIATKEQRAEFKRMEFWGSPDDPKKKDGYISAAAAAYARQTVEAFKRDSQSAFGMVGGMIADAFIEAVDKETPVLKLNFQNDYQNAMQAGGGLASVLGLSQAQDGEGMREPGMAFGLIQASIAGLEQRVREGYRTSVVAGDSASSKTYADSLGRVEDSQLQELKKANTSLDLIAKKETAAVYDF